MTAEATGKVLITFTFFLNEIPINCAILNLRGEGKLSSGPRAGSDFPPLPACLTSFQLTQLRSGLAVLQHDVIVTASYWWRSKHDPAVKSRHSGGGRVWSPLREERGVSLPAGRCSTCLWTSPARPSSSPSCVWLAGQLKGGDCSLGVSVKLTERPVAEHPGELMASFEV